MYAFLLTLVLFVVWSLIGLAGLVALGRDTRDVRIALSAPVLGSAFTVVPLVVLSIAGVPMEIGGRVVGIVAVSAAVVLLAWRRPRLRLAVAPVAALATVGAVLVGRPLFEFGFDWIGNANGDMGFYVLAAAELLHHGLLTPVDVHALAQDRDLPTFAQFLGLEGVRPGTQIGLAALSADVGRSPTNLYMPMLLAANMAGVCAVGSLAMQSARKWWVAALAAALYVASPLATYGAVQALTPQVWGLGLGAALASWLMRPELHRRPGPSVPDLVIVATLAVALFLVYIELTLLFLAGYGLYVLLLGIRRQLSVRSLALLWSVPIVSILVATNAFLGHALHYLHTQVRTGTANTHDQLHLFAYSLVPDALAGITGIRSMFAAPTTPGMTTSIVVSAILVVGALVVSVRVAWAGAAAGIVVIGELVVALELAWRTNDFGLFKLYMYIQPFLAAALAIWFGTLRSRGWLVVVGGLLVVLVGFQLRTQNLYVSESRNPVDLPHASGHSILPAFDHLLASTRKPIVSATENLPVLELQGAAAGTRPIYFLSRNGFNLPWQEKSFRAPLANGTTRIRFGVDPRTAKIMNQGSCELFFPTGTQLALNRSSLPEGSPDFAVIPCSKAKNLLAYVVSDKGQPPYLPLNRRAVSFWQLVADPWFKGNSLSGFGRFALYRLLGASPGSRLRLTLTTSPFNGSGVSTRLPPAAVIGSSRTPLPLVGSGSARVFSGPLRPQIIDGAPYLVIDMGRKGKLPLVRRPGATGLWGKSIAIDSRLLTSYVRDISLIPAGSYAGLRAPSEIRRFPQDLGNPDLEYSGIYEDGWVGRDSYVYLSGGPRGRLSIAAEVLPTKGTQRLRVLVDGKAAYVREVSPGELRLRLPLPASRARRKIELLWSNDAQLHAPDARRASALISEIAVK